MAVNLSPIWGAGAQLLDNSGNVLSGGKIYTYAAGTTTPATTYTSFNGITANSNPIILNSAGRVPFEIWLMDGVSYKFVLKDSNETLIGTWDNLNGINSNFIAYTAQQEIQTATAGQTVFNLTTMQYQPATNNLSVYVDGVNQYGPGAQYAYVETDSDTVTFVSGLHVGASVKFTTASPVSSGSTNAENVAYDPPFTGAVGTNVELKLAQTVSVKDFGAVGDGVTDDTQAIQDAIDECYSSGNILNWVDGTYLTTSSIANFHSVQHRGTGAVKRGTDLFYPGVIPQATNVIYVSAAGSDTNDGLSSSQPFATAQAAGNVIYNYPYADVTWVVQFAAGTYSGSNSFSKAFPTPNRVQFLGASVSDGTTPTTVFDNASAAGNAFVFSNNTFVFVQNIFVKNYVGTGLTTSAGSDLYTRNYFASNCTTGINAASECKLRVQAGIISNCGTGIQTISNVTFTIGYAGTAADINGVTGTAILNCNTGFAAQESATGHLDYCYIANNIVSGATALERSRMHILGSVITGNNIGVRCRGLSSWFDNPGTPNTVSGNVTNVILRSSSIEVSEYQDAFGPALVLVNTAQTVATTSSTPLSTTVYTFDAGQIVNRSAGFVFSGACNVVGVTGTKLIEVKLGSTTLLSRTMAASSTAMSFEVEFVVYNGSSSFEQQLRTCVYENGIAPIVAVSTQTLDLTSSLALTLEISSASGDTIRSRIRKLAILV